MTRLSSDGSLTETVTSNPGIKITHRYFIGAKLAAQFFLSLELAILMFFSWAENFVLTWFGSTKVKWL